MYEDPISIELDNFTIKLYYNTIHNIKKISEEEIQTIQKNLCSKQFPNEVLDGLAEILINNKIEILDKNNNILILSEIITTIEA